MDTPNSKRHARGIRSFVRREGRLTAGQRRALHELWPKYGLPADTALEPARVFGRTAPVTLEIGFGNGETLATLAAAQPQQDFIGIEVHRPGVGQLLRLLEQRGIDNVRVCNEDAVRVLRECIPDDALDRVLLFFPDPWHKQRHHKRRLVQPAFIHLLAGKLKAGGILHMATDWEDYAGHMLAVMQATDEFDNCAAGGGFSPKPDYRPVTKFERRGRQLGHGVRDLLFRRL